MKNYIGLFTEAENREQATIDIDKQVDVAFTMIADIYKYDKTAIVHSLLKPFLNEKIANTDRKTISLYSKKGKNTDLDAKQLARLIAVEKILEEDEETEADD